MTEEHLHPYHLNGSIFIYRAIRRTFYAPTFEKVGSILVLASLSLCPSMRPDFSQSCSYNLFTTDKSS